MAWSIDARIPVTLLPDAAALPGALAGRPAALLAEGTLPDAIGAPAAACFVPAPRHAAACTCCSGRNGVALALDRLFQDRLRGRAPWFDRVLVLATTEAARAECADALTQDAVTVARFRPG